MRPPPTREDRLLRLKLRLGWRPHKYRLRIKPGGWITLPPALGVRASDYWEIERIDDTLILRRVDPATSRRPAKRIARRRKPIETRR